MAESRGVPVGRWSGAGGGGPDRGNYTFALDRELVERARREVGEREMVRSMEAALDAAIDYTLWVREVSTGKRDVLS